MIFCSGVNNYSLNLNINDVIKFLEINDVIMRNLGIFDEN